MPRLTVILFALLLVVAACAHTQPQSDNEPVNTVAPNLHCGYERWAVKTGTDPAASQVNLTPKESTIAELANMPSPLPPVKGKYPPQTKREPQEMQAYSVKVQISEYAAQQDGDIHIVIKDGNAHMIAEIPNPQCVKGGPFLAQITKARSDFIAKTGYNPPIVPKGHYTPGFVHPKQPISVTMTGVLFFDFIHAQRGVANNGVELHPVIGVKF